MKDDPILEVGYWRSISTNQDRTWREKIGMWLRRLADRMDGRITVAIEMRSIPPIPLATRYRIVRKGINVMDGLLLEAACSEAEEAALREIHPSLFEEAK